MHKVPKQCVLIYGSTAGGQAPLGSNTPLQSVMSPNSFTKCLTLGEGRAFVNMSTTMLSVGQ